MAEEDIFARMLRREGPLEDEEERAGPSDDDDDLSVATQGVESSPVWSRHQPTPTHRPVGVPDVTVVVGSRVFAEHSKHLCCWSGYFEAAFRSGMLESASRKFEFPDRNPDEWEWIVHELLVPFSSARITLDNLETALGWFDFLCVSRGMEEGDRVLTKAVLELELDTAAGLTKMLEYLSIALQYNLQQAKSQYFQLVRAVLNRDPTYLTKEHLDAMALLILGHDDDCRKELWDLLEKYLPSPIHDKTQQDCLLHTGALQSLVLSELENKRQAKELDHQKRQASTIARQFDTLQETHTQRLTKLQRKLTLKTNQMRQMVSAMDEKGNWTVSRLKRHLRFDAVCGVALPRRWSREEEEEEEEEEIRLLDDDNEDDGRTRFFSEPAKNRIRKRRRVQSGRFRSILNQFPS